jgi:hypothetical protein
MQRLAATTEQVGNRLNYTFIIIKNGNINNDKQTGLSQNNNRHNKRGKHLSSTYNNLGNNLFTEW